MKIRLAVLEKDRIYLNRMAAVFGGKYADKCEMHGFTDLEEAMAALERSAIDVLLANANFDIDVNAIPKRCGFAYLVESADIDTVKDQPAISKFQMADQIYKQVQMVYSDHASHIGFKMDGVSARTILFTSVSGGVGSSTLAAACARHFAAMGKKVMYLNLEKFGVPDHFFQGQGQYTMSDVIFAVKSKKPNLNIKLQSCVRQDHSGVRFFAQAPIALDMMELKNEDITTLLETLQRTCDNEYIIVDADFSLEKQTLELMRQMHAIVLVGSGTIESNLKTERAFEALNILEANADLPLSKRMCFMYNMVSSQGGSSIACKDLRILGGAPKYNRTEPEHLLGQLQQLDEFNKIL